MDVIDLRRVKFPDEYPPLTRRLLLPLVVPLAGLYWAGVGLWRRLPSEPFDAGIPVVSVGSLAIGGTGKTPVCMRIAARYRDLGRKVCILSRGYRRRSVLSPLIVSDRESLKVEIEAAGDEPYMMAKKLTGVAVVVGKDRQAAAIAARDRLAADLLVLDDGFQARDLARQADVLCFDRDSLRKGNRPLPWGSLREGWSAIGPEHLVVVVGRPGALRPSADELAHLGEARVFHAARSAPAVADAGDHTRQPGVLSKGRFALVSGIARPASVERSCLGLGVDIPVSIRFRDHHWYTNGDAKLIMELLDRYACTGILTTEKDYWKLSGTLREISLILRTQLDFLEPDDFWKGLDERLGVG